MIDSGLVSLQIGVPGGTEVMILVLIAVLLFGASKVPALARSSGKAVGEYKKNRQKIEGEIEDIKGTASLDEEEAENGDDEESTAS